jgi:methionine aminopeptidase
MSVNLNLDDAVQNLTKALKDVQVNLQILNIVQRITALELHHEGTKVIENLLGHSIK